MLSDDELPPLPYPHMSSGVAHYHSGFTYAQMREYARAAERAAYERAAQIVKPKSPRPCDCDACDCGNSGDLSAVIRWDEATMLAAAICALGGNDGN